MTYNTNKNNKTNLVNLWRDYSSPLRYLTKSQIQTMLDCARHGNDSRLQVAFYEMERTMPIYGVVLQRRLAGVQNKKWRIIPIVESEKATNQAAFISDIFSKADSINTDGLSEAIRHLTLASFRGRSAVKPFFDKDTNSLIFKKLDNWNFLEFNNKLYWCPKGTNFLPDNIDQTKLPDNVYQISDHEVAWLKEERPIDIPGIEIYLRQIVGEDGWSRATEKYGVAQVIVTPPEGTPDSALPEWSSRAVRIVEGGFGVLPPGSKVDQLTDARGQDPFSKYVEHQTEQIVLLACGSTLGSIAGGTGLGSGLAESQENTFNSLVLYDCRRIGNALSDSAIYKICKAYNEPVLCKFEFYDDEKVDINEILTIARFAKDAGFGIDIEKLKSKSNKFDFIKQVNEIDEIDDVNKIDDVKETMDEKSNIWSP